MNIYYINLFGRDMFNVSKYNSDKNLSMIPHKYAIENNMPKIFSTDKLTILNNTNVKTFWNQWFSDGFTYTENPF